MGAKAGVVPGRPWGLRDGQRLCILGPDGELLDGGVKSVDMDRGRRVLIDAKQVAEAATKFGVLAVGAALRKGGRENGL
jgi:hypothetical protein